MSGRSRSRAQRCSANATIVGASVRRTGTTRRTSSGSLPSKAIESGVLASASPGNPKATSKVRPRRRSIKCVPFLNNYSRQCVEIPIGDIPDKIIDQPSLRTIGKFIDNFRAQAESAARSSISVNWGLTPASSGNRRNSDAQKE